MRAVVPYVLVAIACTACGGRSRQTSETVSPPSAGSGGAAAKTASNRTGEGGATGPMGVDNGGTGGPSPTTGSGATSTVPPEGLTCVEGKVFMGTCNGPCGLQRCDPARAGVSCVPLGQTCPVSRSGATDAGSGGTHGTAGDASPAGGSAGAVTSDAGEPPDAGRVECQHFYAGRPYCPSTTIVNCCDCLCDACGAVAAVCGRDIRCHDLMECATVAHCTSLDECNQPTTCKLIIEGLGGPQNISAIRAAAVLACAVEARCDPCEPMR
jgi:hypothetical protein